MIKIRLQWIERLPKEIRKKTNNKRNKVFLRTLIINKKIKKVNLKILRLINKIKTINKID
jgi:hypothetical protein